MEGMVNDERHNNHPKKLKTNIVTKYWQASKYLIIFIVLTIVLKIYWILVGIAKNLLRWKYCHVLGVKMFGNFFFFWNIYRILDITKYF